MLFNSGAFILEFLPLALLGYYALARLLSRDAAIVWVGLCSVVFYAEDNLQHLPLLLVSVGANLALGRLIAESPADGRQRLLWGGVATNLLCLGIFKYTGFLVANANAVLGTGFEVPAMALPVGISFFTFTQIAYLVDACRGEARPYRAHEYVAFITYFPHLIAGPILIHKDFIPQLGEASAFRFRAHRLLVGGSIFIVGLFKKVVIADGIAGYADAVFGAAAAGEPLGAWAAWIGAIAYTLQLYFDFSGYSDMAFGLSHMFGLRIPVNFLSPYQSASIIEFWRRWHISLSRFLADYVYKPLGGNRRGRPRRYANLMLTMLLGGLWHGAGWTFVLWGGLHGLFLAVNHAWRGATEGTLAATAMRSRVGRLIGFCITFPCIVLAWVLFRAENLPAALAIYGAMFDLSGTAAPFASLDLAALHLALPLAIALLAPSVYELMRRYIRLEARVALRRPSLAWRMTPAWAMVIGGLAILCAMTMFSSQPSPFLYFQF